MSGITLELARKIIDGALEHARREGMMPLGVVVLDQRGAVKAYSAEDGTSLFRFKIAYGKANGAIGMGFGSAELARRAAERPQFLGAVNVLVDGGVIPAPGGVLVRDGNGEIIGAVGISGDVSHNDEACAVAGIRAAGLVADPG